MVPVNKMSKELQAIFVLDERTIKIENEVKQEVINLCSSFPIYDN